MVGFSAACGGEVGRARRPSPTAGSEALNCFSCGQELVSLLAFCHGAEIPRAMVSCVMYSVSSKSLDFIRIETMSRKCFSELPSLKNFSLRMTTYR